MPHPAHGVRGWTFTSSLAAKVAVSDRFVFSFSPGGGADRTRLRAPRLGTAHPGIWAGPTTRRLTARGRLRFMFAARRGWLLPPAAALPVTEREIVSGNVGKMPGSKGAEAAAVPAIPPAHSSSSSVDSDPLVQYVALRRDLATELNWPLGALVAQACHAAVAALGSAMEDSEEIARRYLAAGSSMRTVVLQVSSESELLRLRDKLKQREIGHVLWREEPEMIPTALASVPIRKSAGRIFKGLKLLL